MDRVNILGVGVHPITMAKALEQFADWLAKDEREFVCIRDAHGVVRCLDDEDLRRIHNKAGLVTPDGMPLVWICRHQGHDADRVYGPDLLLAVCERFLPLGVRHYFYGGGPGVAAALASKLSQSFPTLQIAGTWSPPFRPALAMEEEDVLRQINLSNPDIIWVGLSTPKQEYWMSQHREHLNAKILVGVGAAFDFHCSKVRQAPRTIQLMGLEWLFRLMSEPRRLWRRYLEVVPRFSVNYAMQHLGVRPPRALETEPKRSG